jgi:DNA-binding GntR family transcriptional regulator
MIITLELVPGSLISESVLMSKLGFGRTPIREALRSLADEKLVEVYPRRGMFVSSVDVQNLSALSEIRAVLEIKAAELAAERSTQADHVITRALIVEINYYAHALRIWFLALDRVAGLTEAIIEHRALLEAISSSDSKAAGKAMHDHVEGFETSIRKSL